MHKPHMHIRERMHMHTLRHWIHDPRFWAIVAVVFVFGLLILGMWLTAFNSNGSPYQGYPMYPYLY
jgi:hypothetical protein